MAYTPAVSISLPITITVGDLPCEAGTITIDPGDVAGSIRSEFAAFLREAANIVEGVTDT
ncbi:hypothetical protein [Streptomyces sp. NBC_01237]|uniref:hypothetical protein n=1 Tax=Streptomyces sp. NBC_01237 TaxID=2903790 RepID=UPI002DD867E6|nr:hypothetical protein [Streptomyces sp. NBC_01237]WRZ73788.1 hypothetical protein OG251_20320 [Streptomyces sp. NBC_01237]